MNSNQSVFLAPLIYIISDAINNVLSICMHVSRNRRILRDVGQAIGIILMAMMFLSPPFYLTGNSLTFIKEQALNTAAALIIAWAGYALFQKSRKGFADVL